MQMSGRNVSSLHLSPTTISSIIIVVTSCGQGRRLQAQGTASSGLRWRRMNGQAQ